MSNNGICTETLAELSQDFGAPPLKTLTITELLQQEFKLRELILDPWITTQSLNMIYAPRGIGKTHVSLGIAYAIASGGKFLNWQANKPHGVLFIDGEMPGNALKERVANIVLASDKETIEPLNFLTPDMQKNGMPDLATSEGQEQVESFISDEIELIIIDNLSCLVRSGRENEGESWLPIQDWALRLRAKGKSILFIHHSNKNGAQRGTSRREDVLDCVINLKHPLNYTADQGASFEVHYEKSRYLYGDVITPFEARLTTDDGGKQCWFTRTIEESTFDKVITLTNDGLCQKEIADELDIHKSTVSRHVQKAKAAGLLKNGVGL